MMRPIGALALTLVGAALSWPAEAEVKTVTPRHVTMEHRVELAMPQALAWRRLVRIQDWWAGSHTYSGDARNLRLDVRPGGCWCERWSGGGVEHARVVYIEQGKALRLAGGLGPLQSMAVNAVLDIELKPVDGTPGRTAVLMRYVINGTPESNLDRIAPAVDRVLGEQMASLAAGR